MIKIGVIPGSEELCDIILGKPEEYTSNIKSGRTLALFMADWCGPCVEFIRDYKNPEQGVIDFLKENRIKTLYVDTDAFPGLSNKNYIHVVPSMRAFSEGREVGWLNKPPESSKDLLSWLQEVYALDR